MRIRKNDAATEGAAELKVRKGRFKLGFMVFSEFTDGFCSPLR